MLKAIAGIEEELEERVAELERKGKMLEAQRLGCGPTTTWR
jgi:excinuclease ABC subunit B